MHLTFKITFLLFLFPAIYLVAQKSTDTIPFTLNKQNNICVKAQINTSDTLILMFHTSATGITLINEAIGKKLQLNLNKSDTVKSWGGSAEAKYSEGNILSIGSLTWKEQTIFINENSGEGTDGKFGFNFFLDKILEIDYDKKIMLVHSKLPVVSGFHKMKLLVKPEGLYIRGSLLFGKTTYTNFFLFHTGYGGAVLLDPKIAEQYSLSAELKTISSSSLQDSYGNVFKIETKLLPGLTIGNQKLNNVPLSFALRASEIPMIVFGNGLLKRFNVIFDFRNKNVFLKPNTFKNVPYST